MTTEILTIEDVERIEAIPLETRLPGSTGYEALLAIVARFPDRIAITALESGSPLGDCRNVTFTQLLENVNRTANMFRSRGLKSDESVTHFLPLVPEGFYVKIAAETMGIVTPVNPMLEVEHIVGITRSANTRILVIPGKDCSQELFNKGCEVAAANPDIHTVYVLSPDGYRDKVALQAFWTVIERQQVTILMAVPTVLSALLNVPVGDANLSSLRTVFTGGSAVPTELMKAVSEQIGMEVAQGFGMTEIGGMSLMQMQPDLHRQHPLPQ